MTGDISFIVMYVILQPAGPKYTTYKWKIITRYFGGVVGVMHIHCLMYKRSPLIVSRVLCLNLLLCTTFT